MTYIPQKDLFRPDEVAKCLSISRATVYRWIYEGKLKSIKVGNRLIRIPRYAILKVLKSS